MFRGKKSHRALAPEDADKCLYLFNGDVNAPGDSLKTYNLSGWNSDNEDYAFLMPIFCDAAELLLRNHTVFSCFECASQGEKHFFPRKEPVMTESQKQINNMLNYLTANRNDDCAFWLKEDKSIKGVCELLYVAKRNLTSAFVKEAYIDTVSGSDEFKYFDIYLDGYSNINTDVPAEIEKAVSNYDYDISLRYDSSLARFSVDYRQSYCSFDEVATALSIAAQKHNKRLEVRI